MPKACQNVTKRRENSPLIIPALPQCHSQAGAGLWINMIRVIAVVICRPPDNETLQSLWQDSKKFSPFQSIQSGGPAAAARLARITTQDMTTTTMQVLGN